MTTTSQNPSSAVILLYRWYVTDDNFQIWMCVRACVPVCVWRVFVFHLFRLRFNFSIFRFQFRSFSHTISNHTLSYTQSFKAPNICNMLQFRTIFFLKLNSYIILSRCVYEYRVTGALITFTFDIFLYNIHSLKQKHSIA